MSLYQCKIRFRFPYNFNQYIFHIKLFNQIQPYFKVILVTFRGFRIRLSTPLNTNNTVRAEIVFTAFMVLHIVTIMMHNRYSDIIEWAVIAPDCK